MKLLKSKPIALGLTTLLLSTIPTSNTFASTIRNLEAYYDNIQITVNDQYRQTSVEPFIVDGITYVGVRDIGNLFNITADWDSSNKMVKLSGGLSSTNELAYQQQLLMLNNQIEDLEAKIKQYEQLSGEIFVGDLATALTNVANTFYNEYGMLWTFSVDEYSTYLYLEIEFDGSKYLEEFSEISSTQLNRFIEDVCDVLLDGLVNSTIEDMKIKGEVYDTANKDILALFEYDNYNLTVEEYESTATAEDSEVNITDMLETEYSNRFTNIYTIYGNRFSLNIVDFSITEKSNGAVYFVVEVDASDYLDDWNNIDTDYLGNIVDILDDIVDEIEANYELSFNSGEIVGYIDSSSGSELLAYDRYGLHIHTVE
ncbi:MAG: hypothetical protein BEN19_08495 [Epulopiscium sp. Nuni2H_MBin003]|nr:MAG: hypothetical protein BEN19_08495 [Epulopiscium sp. Nuni2H_MBin003]